MAKSFEGANTPEVLNALLESDQTLNSLGIGTAAIIAGFKGKVEAIRFDEVSGPGIQKRNATTGAQTIKIAGRDEPVTLATEGEYPSSLFLIFEGGSRKLAIPAMFQNVNSSITFEDGSEVSAMHMTGKQWGSLKDKTLECTEARSDEDNMIPRPKRGSTTLETEMRPSRIYKFKVIA